MKVPNAKTKDIGDVTYEAKYHLTEAVSHIILAGTQLKVARGKMPVSDWHNWLDSTLDIQPFTAQKIISCADFLDKGGTLEDALTRFY